MSVMFGSVYSIVFATLGAATERKRQKTEKKLCRTMLRPKGTERPKGHRKRIFTIFLDNILINKGVSKNIHLYK